MASNGNATQGPSNKAILLESIEQDIGAEALMTLPPVDVDIPEAVAFNAPPNFEAPVCMTQSPIPPNLIPGASSIVVGLEAECPRWDPGSVVKYVVFSKGWDSEDDAIHAGQQLAIASKAWNDANVGVTFEWTQNILDATFVLCFGQSKGSALAEAFFPNFADLNRMFVYRECFQNIWKQNMWKVFCHELGHVLGLRHEFALEGGTAKAFNAEPRLGAVQLGPRNPLSVMMYRKEPPEIQQSDIESTREFYALRRDPVTGIRPTVSMTPIVDYTPQ